MDRLLGMVRALARTAQRRAPMGHVLFDDLYSAGLLALVEAAGRFDPARGVSFWAFATHRVRGAMLDELRQLDTVSRDRRSAMRSGEEPPEAPVCPRLVDLSQAALVADPMIDPEVEIARRERLQRLRSAEAGLPERLRLVLHLRLVADWSLRQIADHLGVTQGRACRLVGKGVARLRKQLEVDGV